MKFSNSLIDSLGTPYDYRSVMHYSENAFSKNGLPTILVKHAGRGVCTVHYKIIYISLEQSPYHYFLFSKSS